MAILNTWLVVLACTKCLLAVKDQPSSLERLDEGSNNRRFVVNTDSSSGNCSFEVDLCFWQEAIADNFDWTRTRGPTATTDTGPASDHTSGDASGFYMYIEASAPRRPGDTAILQSPILPAYDPLCLRFYYNMHGATTGTLRIVVQPQGASGHTVWQRTGDQGEGWHLATVSVAQATAFQVFIEGVRGQSYHGDIAIDDLAFTAQACAVSPLKADPNAAVPITTPSSKVSTPGSSNRTWECTFEAQNCFLSNSVQDNFDWTRHSGGTASSLTGPLRDHTIGNNVGHYMYVESSAPRRPGDSAVLQSSMIHTSTPACLQFYYNMYGSSIGTLSVSVQPHGAAKEKVWELTGAQGNYWQPAAVTVASGASEFQVFFDAIIGNGYHSDIAIDDVVISHAPCKLIPIDADRFLAANTTAVTATDKTKSQCQCDCTFEIDTCFWTNSQHDIFDWTRHNGPTASSETGPNDDHTLGNWNGHYMYIEASTRTSGDIAILQSPILSSSSSYCLQFYYNMDGRNIGTLNVTVQSQGSNPKTLWSVNGDKGEGWKFAAVSIAPGSRYQVQFVASTGDGFMGDIAIDDVSFTDNACILVGNDASAVSAATTAAAAANVTAASTTASPAHVTTSGQSSNCPCTIGLSIIGN